MDSSLPPPPLPSMFLPGNTPTLFWLPSPMYLAISTLSFSVLLSGYIFVAHIHPPCTRQPLLPTGSTSLLPSATSQSTVLQPHPDHAPLPNKALPLGPAPGARSPRPLPNAPTSSCHLDTSAPQPLTVPGSVLSLSLLPPHRLALSVPLNPSSRPGDR